VDDGLRSGLITLEQLEQVPLFAGQIQAAREAWPKLSGRRLIHETVRRMINVLALDLMDQSRANIAAAGPASVDEVRACPPLVAFSPELFEKQRSLKAFLRENLYQHYRVRRMTAKAKRIVSDLFQAFLGDVRLLPPQYQEKCGDAGDQASAARIVSDYIAGMTDRYAMAEHRRLFAVGEI
jgi:dGTPase